MFIKAVPSRCFCFQINLYLTNLPGAASSRTVTLLVICSPISIPKDLVRFFFTSVSTSDHEGSQEKHFEISTLKIAEKEKLNIED